jgi:hypothetical protein
VVAAIGGVFVSYSKLLRLWTLARESNRCRGDVEACAVRRSASRSFAASGSSVAARRGSRHSRHGSEITLRRVVPRLRSHTQSE